MGEKLSDLEQFYPDRMASRILGMGDVLSLIEKAQDTIDERQGKGNGAEAPQEAQFGFDDYLESMNQMKNMGGISKYPEHDAGYGRAQMKQIWRHAIDEKQMARDRGDHPFHDTEGACESGYLESVPQAQNCQMAQAWTSAR